MEDNFEINAITDSLSENLSLLNFPSDVYKWMKINAKPKMALKLMQVCKYFQHSDGFPYLVVKRVLKTPNRFDWYFEVLHGRKIEAENLEGITQNLWIIGNIEIFSVSKDLCKDISTLLRKTAVCNIQILILCHQQLTVKEFKFLTDGGMITDCHMFETTITFENGEDFALENIFECLPNARIIRFGIETPSIFSLEAAEAKISLKLKKLNLCISSNNFNFQTLFNFMKNHQKIQYTLNILGISLEEFEENITPSFNKMIQEWSPQNEKPLICRC